MVEVAGRCRDAGMAELAGDDGDVHPFSAELGGVGVAQAVGVDPLFDARPSGKAFEHDPDVCGGHRATAERAEDRVATERIARERKLNLHGLLVDL